MACLRTFNGYWTTRSLHRSCISLVPVESPASSDGYCWHRLCLALLNAVQSQGTHAFGLSFSRGPVCCHTVSLFSVVGSLGAWLFLSNQTLPMHRFLCD